MKPDGGETANEASVDPERIARNVSGIRRRLERACEKAGRDPGGVRLMAVTKNRPPEAVDLLFGQGVKDIGENRVQEALAKAPAVSSPVTWHMVGHLQKNKAGKAAGFFSSLHSAASTDLLAALDRRLAALPAPPPRPFPVYVQVNVSGEASKFGIEPGALTTFLEAFERCPQLEAAGLMTIPPFSEDPEAARPFFQRLAALARDACEKGLLPSPPGLSMGMTNDFEVAVEEGATVVRVGTAFFA